MERNLHSPETYDYRQYDRVWQRVAPNLEPYPGFRSDMALADLPGQPTVPAPPLSAPMPVPPAVSGLTASQEAALPGATPEPCCMGTAAEEMLSVIQGFIEAELADRRYYLAFSRQSPSWARPRLRELAAAAGAQARRLSAVYYLITGTCYQAAVSYGRVCVGHWCPSLRERYHVEVCNAMNYLRASEGTTDPCLTRLLADLGEDSYVAADVLLEMLERGMQA